MLASLSISGMFNSKLAISLGFKTIRIIAIVIIHADRPRISICQSVSTDGLVAPIVGDIIVCEENAMKGKIIPALWIFILMNSPFVCHGESKFIGVVKTVDREAFVIRNAQPSKVVTGMTIQIGDVLKTGADGSMGLIFSDDTVISLGPNTEFAIKKYLFDPIEGKLSFFAKMAQGTISFLCGQIAKLAPDSVRVEIPAATIGLRGTHFLVKAEQE